MKNQVFISFRGSDERLGLLNSIKQTLIDGNMNVLTDEDLTGKPLNDVFANIRNSKIVIVIFSKNYAESEWCLDELVEIKKCIDVGTIKALIPIFHMVKFTSVLEQFEEFGEKFLAFHKSSLDEEDNTEKDIIMLRIEKWRKALEAVTSMVGLSYHNDSPEADVAKKVLEKVNMNIARIAANEGRPTTLKMTELSPYTIVLNNNQLTINSQRYYSTTLDALNVEKWNPHQIYDLPSSSGHKRSNSENDKIHQFSPYPMYLGSPMVEAYMSQKQDHIDQHDSSLDDTTCLSHLRYSFFSCLIYCYGICSRSER